MYGRTKALLFRCAGSSFPYHVLPQPLVSVFGDQQRQFQIIRKASNTQFKVCQRKQHIFGLTNAQQNVQLPSNILSPNSHQYMGTSWVSSSGISFYQQKELTKINEDHGCSVPGTHGQKVAMEEVKEQLVDMVNDIHKELDAELLLDSELSQLSK